MELFLPSLFVIVIAALLAFVIIPRMGSLILAITSLLALIVAGIHHYNLFYAEYQLSTWQNGIGANAPFFVLGLAILFIIGAIFYMFTGGSVANVKNVITNTIPNALPSVMPLALNKSPMENLEKSMNESIQNMPPASTATNPLTGAINTGLKNMMGAPTPNMSRPPNNKPANNKSPMNMMPM